MIQNDFNDFMGVVWVQPDGPNTVPHVLLCVDVDGVDEPQGDISIQLCRQADRSWKTVLWSQGTPGQITFDMVANKGNSRSWMQKQMERRCPMPVYFHHSTCGRQDVFLNYDAGELVQYATITSKTKGNMARGRTEEGAAATPTTETFSFAAGPPSPEYYPVLVTVQDADAEDEALRDIASCSTPQCQGACGELVDPCDSLQLVADALAGAKADGYGSVNGGGLWTAWAAQPYATTQNIASVVCFDIDRTTKRILVARGTIDGGPGDVAYSDDAGDNWVVVDYGTTNDECAFHGGALFALDARHIWIGTNLANVYFSADGGLSWTDQGAPAPTGLEKIFCVDFVDENYGMAVGGLAATSGYFIETTDGGANWSYVATEPAAVVGTGVVVLDAYRAWVTMENGALYYTNDWAATAWHARALPVTPVALGDIDHIDDYALALCGHYLNTLNYPVMYRTFNGGYDWEHYVHGTAFSEVIEYYGLNAIIMCSYNQIYAVGEELVGGASAILHYKPAGW